MWFYNRLFYLKTYTNLRLKGKKGPPAREAAPKGLGSVEPEKQPLRFADANHLPFQGRQSILNANWYYDAQNSQDLTKGGGRFSTRPLLSGFHPLVFSRLFRRSVRPSCSQDDNTGQAEQEQRKILTTQQNRLPARRSGWFIKGYHYDILGIL